MNKSFFGKRANATEKEFFAFLALHLGIFSDSRTQVVLAFAFANVSALAALGSLLSQSYPRKRGRYASKSTRASRISPIFTTYTIYQTI